MTSMNTKPMCSKLCKLGGLLVCPGCQQSFCTQHYVEHRQELSQRIIDMSHEHNLLRQELDSNEHKKQLFARIDMWEQESIRTIQENASKARTALHHLSDQTNNELKLSIDQLAKLIQESQNLDNYTEIDIKSWTQKLRELRQMIETTSMINIDYDEKSASTVRLITVSRADHPSVSANQERQPNQVFNRSEMLYVETPSEKFSDTFGSIEVSPDCLAALCESNRWDGSCVCGIGRYSSKIHHIRFEIANKVSRYCFFGIINASQELMEQITEVKSAYGWWELGYNVYSGNPSEKNLKIVISTGDELTLILNCDNRMIQLHHHRTNTLVSIPVDLRQCPFPWKIVCRLDGQKDLIRILPSDHSVFEINNSRDNV